MRGFFLFFDDYIYIYIYPLANTPTQTQHIIYIYIRYKLLKESDPLFFLLKYLQTLEALRVKYLCQGIFCFFCPFSVPVLIPSLFSLFNGLLLCPFYRPFPLNIEAEAWFCETSLPFLPRYQFCLQLVIYFLMWFLHYFNSFSL